MWFRPSSNPSLPVPVDAAAPAIGSFGQRDHDDVVDAERPAAAAPRRRDSAAAAAAPERSLSGLLAPDDDRAPAFAARMLVFAILFIPWLILYSSIVNLGPMPDAFETYRAGEWRWPVYQWTELLYFSPYVLVTIVPFLVRTNRLLRRFTVTGILGTVIGHLTFLLVPAIATPRPFAPQGLFGAMMVIERQLDGNGAGALPSFHVFWVFLGAGVFASLWPRWRHVHWLWAVAVSLSCVTTGLHSMLDLVAGFAMYLLTWSYPSIARRLRPMLADDQRERLSAGALVELGWNGLLVLTMLHLARTAAPLEVILRVYVLLWLLGRLAQQALVSVDAASVAGANASARRAPTGDDDAGLRIAAQMAR